MLSFEWRELAGLCDKLADLRQRYIAAQRIRHTGLVDALKAEIVKARRQRDLLLQHISTRLAVAARDHNIDAAQHLLVGPADEGRNQAAREQVAERGPLI